MSAGAAPPSPLITLSLPFLPAAPAAAVYAYAIAGYALVSSHPLAELAPWRLPGFALPSSRLLPTTPAASPPLGGSGLPASGSLVFDGIAGLGGQQRHITCRTTTDAIWLDSPAAGSAVISRRQPHITLYTAANDTQTPLLAPALILTLAQQGVFCLHASAVIAGDQLVVFLGESGQGKSTLAAYLASGWRQLVDDVLPLTAAAAPVACLPFPQPLPPPVPTLSSIPLAAACLQPAAACRQPAAVYVLHEGELSLSPLSPTAAALALVRHTVAARLFPPDLLARHLDFCAQLAVAVPVKRLSYLRRHAALPAVRQILAADLGCGAPA